MPQLPDEPGLREALTEIQRTYLNKVRDPELKVQYLDRLIKTGKLKLNPATKQLSIEGGLGNDPWVGSEVQQDYLIDNSVAGGAPGTHDYFRYRFPGVGAFGDNDTLSDALARYVYGDEPSGEGPTRTLMPWELEEWRSIQGGEYVPLEGTPYPRESMNSSPDQGMAPGSGGFSPDQILAPIEGFAIEPQMAPGSGGFQGGQLAPIEGFAPDIGMAPGSGGFAPDDLRGTLYGLLASAPQWDWEMGAPPVPRPTRAHIGEAGYGQGLHDEEGPLQPLHGVSLEQAQDKVQKLTMEFGGTRPLAQALADRHGGDLASWERTLTRIGKGQVQQVNFDTWDKIDVLV